MTGRTRRQLLALTLFAVTLAPALRAHDIPADVRVLAFVKPEGQRLRLIVRVPLLAMRDIDFPRRGAGFVDLARAERSLRDAATLWVADNLFVYEEDVLLPAPTLAEARVSLPSDRSFVSYEAALAHVTGSRLPEGTSLYWEQGMLDVLFEYPIRSDQSRFALHPVLARLGLQVTTAVRFVAPGGAVRAFELHGDPGIVHLDPRLHQAALQFVGLGFRHILDGIDHLLFLLCLVIPFRQLRPLVVIVTAFTAAHSITLIASAYGLAPAALWFPPLIETLIAASILYMSLENIVGAAGASRRWMIAFAFGLVHGFGFSFALGETLQFAGDHLAVSLVAFNAGVELGQLLVLGLLIPVLAALFRYVVAERIGTVIVSALVAHTAWHWMLERWDQLRQFSIFPLDPALVAAALRGLAAAALVFTLYQLVQIVRSRHRPALRDRKWKRQIVDGKWHMNREGQHGRESP